MTYEELAIKFRQELEDIKEVSRKLIKEVDLSDEELLEYINIYPDWEELEVGADIKELKYYKYKSKLYQVIKGKSHKKQEDWKPTEKSLFNEVQPPSIIPEWKQPLGAHDAYKIGYKVTHKGKTWESIADGNVWEPGAYGWKVVN